MKNEEEVLKSEIVPNEDEVTQQTEKKFNIIFELLKREIEYVEK
jgi:hypothetical protein